jgi:hypothetical protein
VQDKHTIGNPSPVVDLSTGTVFCHFAQDNVHAFVTQSTDEGITWSHRTALDAAIKVPHSSWYGSGVGGGTQLPSGRMLILSEERLGYCSDPKTGCKPCSRKDHCLTTAYNAVPVYSDDHGCVALSNPDFNVAAKLAHPSISAVVTCLRSDGCICF